MRSTTSSIIIPNYNGESLLKKNLPSVILAYKNPRNNIKEIIVVDDASTDTSINVIKNYFPEVTIIRHSKNRGFSSAVNTGARTAKGALLVLLNTDVTVSKSFMTTVVGHFSDDTVFGVSLHEKGYGWAEGRFENGYFMHKSGPESILPHISMWVSGGSGVFRRDYWMELGGLDDKLLSPFYWEDVDISYRAWKRGWKCMWEPGAHVSHNHEGTTGKISKGYKVRIQERNQLLVIWKNITSSSYLRKHIRGLLTRVLKHPGYLRVVIMALYKVPILIPLRKKESKLSKVSDEAIFAQFTNS
jgi:O-antigen biosynthesis protein